MLLKVVLLALIIAQPQNHSLHTTSQLNSSSVGQSMFRHMTGNKASLTYYAVLGVPIKATQYEIELAYYELRNEPASQSFLVDRTLVRKS